MSTIRQTLMVVAFAVVGMCGAGTSQAGERPVSFARDIMPMLTRLGCNTTACHNVLQGKGGLKLSPLGSDFNHDFNALARSESGRRVSTIDPDNSLLLKRLTSPESTVKLTPDSEAYRRFHAWMAAGAPGPSDSDPHVVELTPSTTRVVLNKGESASLRITARWSDGVVEDVTRWCRFKIKDTEKPAEVSDAGKITANETGRAGVRVRFLKKVAGVDVLIRSQAEAQDWDWQPENVIDEIVSKTWRDAGMTPVGPVDEYVFLRRVYLQVLGSIPTEQAVSRFLASSRASKRAELIDELLTSPAYAAYWSQVWTEWLLESRRVDWASVSKPLHEKEDRDRLEAWLETRLQGPAPLPTVIREVLTATGSTADNGAVVFYSGHRTHDDLARSFGQVFLGASFRCARCHDHPHGEWGIEDFYGIAAAFKDVSVHVEKGQSVTVKIAKSDSFLNPRTKLPITPSVFGTRLHDKQDTRSALANWLLAEGRMMLAKNIVNRYWARFNGRSLTEWVDDLTPSSAERHPGLLDALARELVEHDFDTKHLIRTICQSRMYQLRSTPQTEDADRWFGSRFSPVRLPNRVVLNAIRIAADSSKRIPEDQRTDIPSGFAALQVLLQESDVECSRGQYRARRYRYASLHLLSDRETKEAILDPTGIVARLIASDATLEDITQRLFFRILHRKPTDEELKSLDQHVKKTERSRYVEDIFWALVNTREFLILK